MSPRVGAKPVLMYRMNASRLFVEVGDEIVPMNASSPNGSGLTIATDLTPGVEVSFSVTSR
jgi:hypothetical protein